METIDVSQLYNEASLTKILKNVPADNSSWTDVDRKKHDPVAIALKQASIIKTLTAAVVALEKGNLRVITAPGKMKRKLKDAI